MSARPIDLERIDRFLSADRKVEDVLWEIRDLVCDLTWAGDTLHEQTGALAKHAPKGFVLGLSDIRKDWAEVGGQQALDRFDALAQQIEDLLRESS